MDRKGKIASIVSLVAVFLVVVLMVFAAPKKCNNGADDDNDGLVDWPNDPGCSSKSDNTETGTAICDNGVDQTNDRDTLADFRLSGGDPGCTSATDSSEIDGDCDDLDDEANDRDTLTDSTDPGCTSTSDTSEIDGECDDSIDSADIDGFPDASDPGCTSTSDPTETDGECDDNVDSSSDTDTLASYGTDPGCLSPADQSEVDGPCDDLSDNDVDGFTDYNADPECGFFGDIEHDCFDTDSGQVFTTQGTASGSFGGAPFSGTDFCVNSTVVKEYFCNPYNLGNVDSTCITGNTTQCVSGACV